MDTNDILLSEIYPQWNIYKKNVRLFDELNKDHNRHLVLNHSIRKKQYSDETINRVQQANERWTYFFNWSLSTLDFVSKYFDQLNLCEQCVNYFMSEPLDEDDILNDSDEEEEDEDADKEEWYSHQKPTIFDLCESCEQKIVDYLTQMSISMPNNSTMQLPLSPMSSIHSIETSFVN